MRLERAFLLDQLQKHQEYSLDDSERSSSVPPTPTDKPLRSKRSHRKTTPPATAGSTGAAPDSAARAHSSGAGAAQPASPGDHGSASHLAISHPHAINPLSSAQSTPDPSRHSNPFFSSAAGPASPHAAAASVNGSTAQPVLPSLHSLPGIQPQTQQTPTPRAYFDPAYDAERSTPAASGAAEAGRPRAYSAAQQQQQQLSDAPQNGNGDTEMRDAGFAAARDQ